MPRSGTRSHDHLDAGVPQPAHGGRQQPYRCGRRHAVCHVVGAHHDDRDIGSQRQGAVDLRVQVTALRADHGEGAQHDRRWAPSASCWATHGAWRLLRRIDPEAGGSGVPEHHEAQRPAGHRPRTAGGMSPSALSGASVGKPIVRRARAASASSSPDERAAHTDQPGAPVGSCPSDGRVRARARHGDVGGRRWASTASR